MRISEHKKLYGIRNKKTGNLIFSYWASSQCHKAIFSTEKKAMEADQWISKDLDGETEIVEFE